MNWTKHTYPFGDTAVHRSGVTPDGFEYVIRFLYKRGEWELKRFKNNLQYGLPLYRRTQTEAFNASQQMETS